MKKKVSEPVALETPDTHELELFRRTFGVDAPLADMRMLRDRYLLARTHPREHQHERIEQVLAAVPQAYEDMLRDALQKELPRFLMEQGLDAITSTECGKLIVAGFERAIWLSLNSRTPLFQLRPEFCRYSGVIAEMVRRLLGQDCVIPERDLSRLLMVSASSKLTGTLQLMPALLGHLERQHGRPLDPELRGALRQLSACVAEIAQDDFEFDGKLNAIVGGVRLGKLVERLRALANGDEHVPTGTNNLRVRDLVDLGNIPTSQPEGQSRRRTSGVASRRIVVRPLSKQRSVAEAVFGDALVGKLGFCEVVFDSLLFLESEPRPWATAIGYAKRYAAAAAAHGMRLALTTRALSEVEPEPKAVAMRAALAATRDDEIYRRWLATQIDERELVIRATKDALEEFARHPTVRERAVRGRGRTPEGPVHIVALNASTAVLPALYGLGPFNRCPDPTIHAAVLARWGRDFGARVRHLSHDALTLDLTRPPRKPADIAWAAIANFAYCPEYVNPVEAAKHVTAPTWSYWWD